jgi:hypothetical protein
MLRPDRPPLRLRDKGSRSGKIELEPTKLKD